jgi:iron(II)-dependent oxidoreductase
MNTRAELLAELDNTDRRTRALLEGLSEEQLAVPYLPGINPPIWELGHAAFFYETFILRALDGSAAAMPGYDEIWDSFEVRHADRWASGVVPEKPRTLDYYTRMIDAVRERLETQALRPGDHYLYKYAIFHQNMHIESLIWSRQALAYAPPPSQVPPRAAEDPEPLGDAGIPGGLYPIGMPGESADFATKDFAFDAEKPGWSLDLEPFKIARTLTSNRAFLAFVEEGGYEDKGAWSTGGQCWLRDIEERHPGYWRRSDDGWQQRFFDQWVDLPLDAPVLHLSFYEAEAWCNWAGRRLPTEFEWEAAARGPEGLSYPWGKELDSSKADLDGLGLARASTQAFSDGESPFGCRQMLGSAWEWTSSAFLPYDGFKVDMYPYMSVLQFGDHKVTRGGSCASSSCLVRNSYRQAYQPGRRDVFTGFRSCVS